jgi:hypothetical protein
MINRAKNTMKELKNNNTTLGSSIGLFRELCKRQDINGALTELIGRTNIIKELSEFNRLTNNWWSEILNRLKHPKDKPPPGLSEVGKWVNQTLELFSFLRDGKRPEKTDSPLPRRQPVFPHVVSFRESHYKRGGLTIFNYDLASLDGQHKHHSVKILTPRVYMPAQHYYCIPNLNRSSRNIWLEPFLTPCKSFDDALKEV